MAVAAAVDHLGLEADVDVVGRHDALDEIGRHASSDRAYEDDDAAGVAGDVERRLPAELAAPTMYTSSPSTPCLTALAP